jgi:hypothetical protein
MLDSRSNVYKLRNDGKSPRMTLAWMSHPAQSYIWGEALLTGNDPQCHCRDSRS